MDDEVFLFLFFLEEVFGNQLGCGVGSLPNPVGNTGDVIVILLRPSNSLLQKIRKHYLIALLVHSFPMLRVCRDITGEKALVHAEFNL